MTCCEKRKFKDNIIVSDGKLLLWLEEVIPQGNRSKSKNQGAILSEQGLEGYIKPIIELWEVCDCSFCRQANMI